MTNTNSSDRGITLVNVFTVTPEKQNSAAAKITEIYENFVRNRPGFIAAEIQKSLDSTTVTAIARWESQQALSAMQQDRDQNLVKILDGEIIHAAPQIYQAIALIN